MKANKGMDHPFTRLLMLATCIMLKLLDLDSDNSQKKGMEKTYNMFGIPLDSVNDKAQ